MLVKHGVCSWTDKSLIDCGRLYTKKGDTASYLQIYSQKMPSVEVDSSTYTIPTKERVKKWLGVTPGSFKFHFKAHQLFTHQSSDYQKLPRVIREDFPHPQGPSAVDITMAEIPEETQEQLMKVRSSPFAPCACPTWPAQPPPSRARPAIVPGAGYGVGGRAPRGAQNDEDRDLLSCWLRIR